MQRITSEDAASRSADVTAANAARLRSLFPAAFTEDGIDFDVLKQLLGGLVDDRAEKFGLNWHGKRRARQLALTPSMGTLRPCPEESVDWDTTQNLMIEGDNLEVLKLLQKSYSGKVKLIYIDPPYNTGKDFVYPDDFRDGVQNYLALTGQVDGAKTRTSSNTEASGRFHTDWLNMLYPRLLLSRSLLRSDGVIAISIDHNELANLRCMLADIFGEENALNTFVWVNNLKGRQISSHGAALTHEYIVVWARDQALIEEFRIGVAAAKALCPSTYRGLNYEVLSDAKGEYVLKNQLYNTNSAFNEATRPNLVFSIHYNATTGEVRTTDVDDLSTFAGFDRIEPHRCNDGEHKYHAWRWGRPKVEQEVEDLAFVRTGQDLRVFTKVRNHATTALKDLVTDIGTNAGASDVKALLGSCPFSHPKPLALIQLLIRCMTGDDKHAVCLDFFAGSGTTAHAVMAENAADAGQRAFVLVQLPEALHSQDAEQQTAAAFCDALGRPRNIAELTKERLHRAGQTVREAEPMFSGDLGFRVFKLDSSNIRAWDPNPEDLEKALFDGVEHLHEGRTEQDVLYELLLKLGLDLCVPIEDRAIAGKPVHSIGAGTLLVCLAKKIAADEVEALALGMAAWREEQNPAGDTTVVFRDSAFADDVAKTNIAAILEQHGLETVRSL